MNNNFSYYLPTKIIYGINELDNISQYFINQKVLLVTSKGHIKRGLLDKLKNINIIDTISDIKSHPEFKDLDKICEKISILKFNIILAIGGGSVIDASKYLIYKSTYNIDLISIPTTAGTGSEITPWATIWNMEEKKKYSIQDNKLFSKIAIYDPNLTLSVPKDITIQTALDTLSHSLESIWNKNANPITINYAIKSAKLIIENILPLSKDLDNLEYRDNIMKACMYAGLAFSNTQTAIAHAMSYYITAYKNIPHGIACSFTLPLLIDNIIGKYDFIDNALKDIFGELSSDKLRDILKELNISTDFKDYGIDDLELEKLKLSLQNNQRANNSLVSI
jgi:alcohol dehydrogenase class IV